jgi:putative Holliday junction resolvase
MPPLAALAIDLGERRTGLAVADALRVTCTPLRPWEGGPDGPGLLEHLECLLAERDVGTLVLGLPLDMDGGEGARAREVRVFAERLARRFPALRVVLQDERLTTKAAEDRLRDQGLRRWQDRKLLRDSVSAALLLEDWIAAGEP